MPYELRGSKVVRSDTGEVVKDHHGDRQKALRHLRALKANVKESAPAGVLGALLGDPLVEAFNPSEHPRGFHGRWIGTHGGKVLRVFHGAASLGDVPHSENRTSMLNGIARVVGESGRSSMPQDLVGVLDKAHGTPAPSARVIARGSKTPAGPRIREGVSVLLEAFGVAGASETPQQSQAIGKQEVATAQKQLSASWNASKHPRGTGGKFSRTTGGRRATRSSSATSRTLGVGSKGSLVKSIQRQIGTKADGIYGPQTRAAVERFQRQHGLQVDGVVGAQTIAALRGNPNARLVKPGPIKSATAKVLTHPQQRKSRTSSKVTVMPKVGKRFAGGVVVR